MFSIFPYQKNIIIFVLFQKLFRILIKIDREFGKGIVDIREGIALSDSLFQPMLYQPQPIPLFKFTYNRYNITISTYSVQKLFQVVLLSPHVHQTS